MHMRINRTIQKLVDQIRVENERLYDNAGEREYPRILEFALRTELKLLRETQRNLDLFN